jgi:hypothetical protein
MRLENSLLEIKRGDVTMIGCEEAVCLGRKAKPWGSPLL